MDISINISYWIYT